MSGGKGSTATRAAPRKNRTGITFEDMAARRAERLVNLVICLLSTRQFISAERIRDAVPGLVRAESNFLVVETLNDALPRVFAVGRTYDEIAPAGDTFRFKTRRCVYTSNLIPNTLVIPI